MKRLLFSIFISFIFLCCEPTSKSVDFTKIVKQIEMRDGVKLNTEIYIPKKLKSELPILINRTPYGLRHDDNGIHSSLSGSYKDLVADGYIFVFQDIRGRFESEGEFLMMRPVRNSKDDIDEGTDTYDTIDWILANTKNNGKVGILGISYGGWLTVMGMIDPHPALHAVSPQASPSDMYIGDDFSHNGAFRLSPSFGYAALMESKKVNAPYAYDQKDVYEFFLDMGPLKNANQLYFEGKLPSWNNFMNHPDYDEYWKGINVDQHLKESIIPSLHVAGWWDAEDFYGPFKIYNTLEKYDENGQNYFVAGPWRHGGWSGDSGDKLGAIPFEVKTGLDFRQNIQSKFFNHFLHGSGDWDITEAQVFQTGSNIWKKYDSWPPSQSNNSQFYLNTNGSLSQKLIDNKNDYRSYISDPSNPVPYSKRPIAGFWQEKVAKALWKVEDQRFSANRPDVLIWESGELNSNLCISGEIKAFLHASTTGSDCDWIVKVIDVYPEDHENKELQGYQLMISDEVIRSKYRSGFSSPSPIEPRKIEKYEIPLHTHSHCFKKGHKVMVHIQSSWFPLIDRNPHVFMNIPEAGEKDFEVAIQNIYNSSEFPSYIVLPLEE